MPGGRLRAAPDRRRGAEPHQPAEGGARGAEGRCGAVGAARRILRDVRPDAVLGAGGYVAGPVGLAAVPRRVPLVLTEADSHLGPDQPPARALGAARVPGLPDRRARRRRATCVTGRPVPPPATDRAAARARFGLGAGRARACSSSAARWARARSTRRRSQALAGADFRVLHACGARDYEALRARLGPDRRPTTTCASTSRPFGEALLASDLCVARAGGSIFEIAAHGRPAILVPYPHAAADHQSANARWMAAGGRRGRRRRRRADAGAAGAARCGALLGDRPRLAAMGRASAALARPRRRQRIADEVLAAATR